ncbi:LysR family transcriptional regulator [Pseudomonas aeruginosa]|uniref:LysR family transcriptional regulator n=6 Tax=Pseudomonas aeruginosa TaxID=287 RepID=UPI00053EE965|nr:LysR family transcriptional regulator [Pseudomonas aeruginosa]EJC9816852.1 LysR family transcriptional regulator [Pseudomonas aeruginosa]EJC9823378.1 LysR family transcriptional regulator [Pseudomonas aeruginosa]EJN1407354.1 LysR family transcriptional regulator [Pseudomonas aeruginosa]EJV1458496.1 LysR family transcriptional regulator [Pseudomonas aeruginosa]EJV1463504.1 LysR family transcriptional regulator [Pseudomonas aeruginosa]
MSDLRQFRHFVALAEHGHYARAAEAVNLSQPALSRSIQTLEGQLGCTLVERGSRGVALTAHGRLVLEHARRLLAGHRALHNAVSQLANLDSGELCLGGGPFPAARLLPEALAGFSSAHPRVRVVLLIEDWQTLRQRLLDDAVELFVADIRELQGDPQLRIHPLREYPGVLFCRPGHPLLRLVRPSAEQLADYPLAGPRLPEAVRGDLARLLQREEPLGIQCDDVLMLKGLVGSSELISLAPWDVVAADVEAGRLALLPWPAGAEPARAKGSAYGLVSRAGRSLSPAAAVFVERVLEQDRRFAAT